MKAVLKMTINVTAALFMLFGITGCNGNNNDLPDISYANNVKLYFKTDFDSTGKQVIKTVDVIDGIKIETIKNIIHYDPFTYLYCTSTGSMSFYKDSLLLVTMVFNIDEGQRHIACNSNGKLVAIKLSDENARLLESLKNYF